MSSHQHKGLTPTDAPRRSRETVDMKICVNLWSRLHPAILPAAVLWAMGGAFPAPSGAADLDSQASQNSQGSQAAAPAAGLPKAKLDMSGHARVGKASFYAKNLGGKKMADGTPMQLKGNNAASKTLPLGTTAMVTNLETGRTAIVTIRDRGPYVKGRIVDLSPSTAKKIGLEPKEGVAKVEVAPLEVPLPDGNLKAGGPYPDPKKDRRTSVAKSNSDHISISAP
jgi:rare lipoprotein A